MMMFILKRARRRELGKDAYLAIKRIIAVNIKVVCHLVYVIVSLCFIYAVSNKRIQVCVFCTSQ